MREAIRKKQPDLWRYNSWILSHDNAPAQTALVDHVWLKLQQIRFCRFHIYLTWQFSMFPPLKFRLRGHRFELADAIKRKLTANPDRDFEKTTLQRVLRSEKNVRNVHVSVR